MTWSAQLILKFGNLESRNLGFQKFGNLGFRKSRISEISNFENLGFRKSGIPDLEKTISGNIYDMLSYEPQDDDGNDVELNEEQFAAAIAEHKEAAVGLRTVINFHSEDL